MYGTALIAVAMIGALIATFNNSSQNKRNNLHIRKNDVMIRSVSNSPTFRSAVTDELSRQKLVFSEEDGTWVKRRQIN